MKSFAIPENCWLPQQAYERIYEIYCSHWLALDSTIEIKDPFEFVKNQNEGLLLRLFFEQAFKRNPIENVMARIIERDFGTFADLELQWKNLANNERVTWLVLGLSFTDFRFHLFPICEQEGIIPFSLSPIMSSCFKQDAINLSGFSRKDYTNGQWANCDWKIVEQRISCLGEPLDIFGEISDCAEEDCKSF